jgi:hypothetical protein
MMMPSVVNTIVDPRKNVTYQVVACRKLSRNELVLSVRHYWSQRKKLKVKPGSIVKIVSILGHDGH